MVEQKILMVNMRKGIEKVPPYKRAAAASILTDRFYSDIPYFFAVSLAALSVKAMPFGVRTLPK